jgi:hypothetical protein
MDDLAEDEDEPEPVITMTITMTITIRDNVRRAVRLQAARARTLTAYLNGIRP